MSKQSDYAKQAKRRKKEFAIEEFGGKCQLCGYDKCNAALDFHHLDPSTKVATPTVALTNWSWAEARKELEKCILLCSNCHREMHYHKEFQYQLERFPRPLLTIPCVVCKTDIYTVVETARHCSVRCQAIAQRKAVRPNRAELEFLLENKSWVAIGKQYGVSDNAVRKWAKSFGLLV